LVRTWISRKTISEFSSFYIIIIIIMIIIIIIIKTLFKEETTFDKTTSIYHVFLNIETIIAN